MNISVKIVTFCVKISIENRPNRPMYCIRPHDKGAEASYRVVGSKPHVNFQEDFSVNMAIGAVFDKGDQALYGNMLRIFHVR